jgi:hypothetical protein
MRLMVTGAIFFAVMICLSCLAGVGRSPSVGDVLFLRTTQDNAGPYFHDVYDLGPDLEDGGNGQAHTSSFFDLYFMTIPLASEFFLPNATLTVYHERNPSSQSNLTAIICRYNATQQEEPGPGTMSSKAMDINSTVDSLTFDLNLQLLKGDRILVWVLGVWSGGSRLDWYWGNNTYPSRLSYPGTAQYIPEYQAALFIPMLIMGTLVAAILYTRWVRACPRQKRPDRPTV